MEGKGECFVGSKLGAGATAEFEERYVTDSGARMGERPRPHFGGCNGGMALTVFGEDLSVCVSCVSDWDISDLVWNIFACLSNVSVCDSFGFSSFDLLKSGSGILSLGDSFEEACDIVSPSKVSGSGFRFRQDLA